MAPSSIVDQVASLVARRDWQRVRAVLSEADLHGTLDAAALETLAEAAWWLGHVNESIEVRRRALEIYQRSGEQIGAARVALLLSEDHRRQGRGAIAESWRRRAARLLDGQPETAEHGYLNLYNGEIARRKGDLGTARALLAEADAIARRTASSELAADVAQEVGRVMIMSGAHEEGLALMDEAMLAATEDRLSPYTTGKIYCCLMSACDDLGDIQRAGEWERTSSAWSRSEGVNVFPGMCRVHQADLLAHFGQWSDAEREAEQACEELREVGWVVGYAYQTIGQIRRRRGDLDGAATAFTRAEELGSSPEAGLSLLLLARHDEVGAMRRISRALAATASPPLGRARLLPAHVEIAVAVGDLDTASAAAAELEEIAAAYGTLKLRATASLARSRVCLAAGEWPSSCAAVTVAMQQWQELNAPYETAVARVLHARLCRALDDHDGSAMSLDIAIRIFDQLGAAADLAEAVAMRGQSERPALSAPGGLSAREIDVLRLVATGATNKMIAADLIVSEKTVARHLSNIFTKLGVSSRAAATAYAYQHHVVDSTPRTTAMPR
jgi:ATP/maltotriose-dependent transcriptional regulator MalT